MKKYIFKAICPYCKSDNEIKPLNLKGPDNFGKSFEGQEIFATCRKCNKRYQYIAPRYGKVNEVIGYVK